MRLFVECPRCFWLDVHHKIKRPPGYPYTLSAAVDYLVKREFDKYRVKGKLPPVFTKEGLDAKLYDGPELAEWRNNFKGISHFDEDLNATLYGAVDDILVFPDARPNDNSVGRGALAVVDYKSSGSREITIYDDYQKQMDTYSYILQRMGYQPHPQAYFVFYQVDKTGEGFQNVLPFSESLRPVKVDSSWVGPAFERAIKLARQGKAPPPSPDCDHCNYVANVGKHVSGLTHTTQSDKDYLIVEE